MRRRFARPGWTSAVVLVLTLGPLSAAGTSYGAERSEEIEEWLGEAPPQDEGPAGEDPPYDDPAYSADEIPSTLPNGEAYNHVATLTVEAASEFESRTAAMSGYGGVAVSENERVATVQWKGPLPAAARSEANEVFAGLEWQSVNVRYSEAELQQRARSASEQNTQESGGYRTVHVAPDNSGIQVEVESGEFLSDQTDTELREIFDVDVSVEVVEVEDEGIADLSRASDKGSLTMGTPLYFDTPPDRNLCTAGIAVRDTRRGTDADLSAAHCGHVGDPVFQNGYGRGHVRRKIIRRDILMFSGYSEGFEPRIYTGNPWSTTKTRQGGILGPVKGARGCTSGSQSGELCGARITHVKTYRRGYGPYVVVTRGAEGGAAGHGDSGGPFYRYAWSPYRGYMWARPIGLVSQGLGTARNGRHCKYLAQRCFKTVGMVHLRANRDPFEFQGKIQRD